MPLRQEGKRQLAAIMFSDIAGYTTLMGRDEQKALELLKKNREIQKPIIEKYRGRWIKELGDGVLASFTTVTDAVMCAGAIQKATVGVENLKLRIGIHLGEVVFENNDVFGDGVNIASRLYALAAIGGICVSEDVYKIVSNKKEIITQFISEEYLKNVHEPVKIYEVSVSGTDDYQKKESDTLQRTQSFIQSKRKRKFIGTVILLLIAVSFCWYVFVYQKNWPSTTGSIPEKSIAVLPFVNMSGDPEQEYFSDGISEEIISVLAQSKDLRVIARTSSFQFKGKNEDLRKIGELLGVATVLEGSVRKSQNKIRITAQLIKTSDGTHIWSKTYDRIESDIFEMQEEIASSVFNSLKASLSLVGFTRSSTKTSTKSFEAYDLFLKARAENRKFHMDPTYLHRSIQLLEEALKIDPEFPEALSLFGYNLIDLTWAEGRNPVVEGIRAREFLNKSVELNPHSSDAYLILGGINFYLDWNIPEAKKNFEKGWALSNYGEAPISQCFCGFIGYTLAKGDYQGALSVLNTVEKLDPNYPFRFIERILVYRILQDTASIRRLLSDSTGVGFYEPVYQYEIGNYQEAIKGFLSAKTGYIWPTSYLASAFFKAGMVAQSDSIIHEMIRRSDVERNLDFGLAVIFSARGEKEQALKWYKSAYAKHDFWLVYSRTDADLKLIIDEPEVKDILHKIGL